jgi:predicted acyl esterase
VRVDIRGSGESDGVIDGEYTPLRTCQCCELIAWIAAQTLVERLGRHDGHFLGWLQLPAGGSPRPPALKAVISIASTVDRYNDDIHYKNGTHLSAQLSWAATMLAYQSRSPDPALVGDAGRRCGWSGWRRALLHGGVARASAPRRVLATWLDLRGFRALSSAGHGHCRLGRRLPQHAAEGSEGLGGKAKALIGPWVHKYPHFAWPKPRADFHGEAIPGGTIGCAARKTGIDALPQMRAYILDGIRNPLPAAMSIPASGWPRMNGARRKCRCFYVDQFGSLNEGMPIAGAHDHNVYLKSPLDTGTASGEWFTLKPDAEMAGDQRIDDAGSLTFETAPLTRPSIISASRC